MGVARRQLPLFFISSIFPPTVARRFFFVQKTTIFDEFSLVDTYKTYITVEGEGRVINFPNA